jgi:outer membrane protein assembly factor BamD
MKISSIFFLIFLSLSLTGCFSDVSDNIVKIFTEEPKRELITKGLSPKAFFETAKLELSEGSTEQAIKLFEQLQAAYPGSKYAIQAKIEVIYTHFKREEYDLAIDKANDYIKLYPNHFSTPYAYYLRGISAEDKSRSILDGFLTDNAQRDVSSVIIAFNYYLDLINKFPDSEYSEEAKSRLIIIRNIIARHELFVAIFYAKKKAYIASINRCNFIIEKYPNTPSVPAALHLLAFNYDNINANDLASDARRVLKASYPEYIPHYSLED